MKIGIPKELKTNENRVSLVPAGTAALVSAGHTVIVETGAGLGSGFSDARYMVAGAQIAQNADAVWAASDLIVKVKEPIEPEWKRIRPGQTIFTYFLLTFISPQTSS
jgi:alanine dehydrogenase